MQRLFSSFIILLFFVSLNYSQIAPPKFSLQGGFYKNSLKVNLTSKDTSAYILYTTDGSEPAGSSHKYISPVPIEKTTVIKAKTFLSDSLYSTTTTSTYFIKENSVLPVFSISTDPKNLWDPKNGIYVWPNYSLDWERPAHLEFYEPDGSLGFSMDAGIKINGESSRDFAQKSLAILARKIYGDGKINYKIFPHLPINEFEVLVLRNSGTDWNNTMFRDGLMHHLLKDTDIDVLAYRPSIVFLNGEYFGIHNIREKSDEHYIASHHKVNSDSLYIVRYWGIQLERGGEAGRKTYDDFEYFASKTDFSIKKNYDSLKTVLDIDEFIGYVVAQVFYDNTDWPANNVKCWKENKATGKWRWILWDTDYGFDYLNKESYKNMSLDFITGGKNPIFPAPPDPVNLILNLLKNEDFKNRFINCFADFTNTFLMKDSLLKSIDEIKNHIQPEIFRHFSRWNANPGKWYENVSILEQFAANRQPYIQQNFTTKFNLKGTASIDLNINTPNRGYIQLNSIKVKRFPWKGNYFIGVPVTLLARPSPGYKFKEWQGINETRSNPVIVDPNTDLFVAAVFEPDSSYPFIVINEINYNSAASFDTEDWIELYNAASYKQDLSGWIFKDDNDQHLFIFPDKTFLGSNEYLVLCRDTLKFSNLVAEVKNRIGNFNFGLNNGGEHIRLFDKSNNIIDSLTFNDKYPWPAGADGSGMTLELKNPDLDNSSPANWTVSQYHGTPGKQNSQYTTVKINHSKIPEGYALFQNYPNPFNPLTTIKYALPFNSRVKVTIFTPLGKLIKELINEEQNAGIHELKYNATEVASGVYFYLIEALSANGSACFHDAGKMLLLK